MPTSTLPLTPTPDTEATRHGVDPLSPHQGKAPSRRVLVFGVVAVAVIVAAYVVLRAVNGRLDAPRYITSAVAYADIDATVQETGTVNPVNEVQVGTQVSGTVASLAVDYNSSVKKGQVLATLDPTSFQAAATQAQASLAQAGASAQSAAANEQQTQAGVGTAQANLNKAQAQLALARRTVQRDGELLAQGYIAQSQADVDSAAAKADAADVQSAQTAVEAAQAQHQASQHQAAAAGAQVQSAQGAASQANYNLQRTVITSPIDGIIVSRNVSVGQTVAASFQTPTLFVIASSLKDMQVDVSVDEADVGQLRTGQSASISVPAYPNTAFRGTVKQIHVNPTTVQNVVTYDTVVAIHDESARLKPGMTANVTIAVARRQHVLTTPVAALLYRPQTAPAGQATPAGFGPPTTSATPPPVAGAPGSHVIVWVLRGRGGKPQPVPIVIGMSDGRNFEIQSGDVREGDRLITGQLQGQGGRGGNPLGGFPR